MKSLFEEMGGIYRQKGDYGIPNIALPEFPHNILGKYGHMRREHLKKHHSVIYNQMVLDGSLYPHLYETDKSCNASGESPFIHKGHPGNPFAALHSSKNLSEHSRWL